MLLNGVTVDIGWFADDAVQPESGRRGFCDRFSFFVELPKFTPGTLSFSAEIGIREAFGDHALLCRAVSEFHSLLLTPLLYTTGIHFSDRACTCSQLEELQWAGVQQIVLRVDESEASALSSDCVTNLVDGCRAAGIDLRLQLELRDTFPEDCLRIARVMEDRQFLVTVLPVRIRPVRTMTLAEAVPLPARERMQLILDPAGEVILRRRSRDEVMDIRTGNAHEQPIGELMAAARART